MNPNIPLCAALVLFLGALSASALADALSELPSRWQAELNPVVEADISGAERHMQEAMIESRQEIAALLSSPDPDRAVLAGAYGRLGALALLLEMEAQADACFRNARMLQPDEMRWPYYAGYLAMMAGNLDQALEYLLAAQGIDPEYPTLYLRLGKVRLERSELTEARAALERVGDAPGLATAANYYLGQIANMERRYRDAIVHLDQALATDPQATSIHYPLAQAYRALGENDLAREHLGRFKLKLPDAKDPLLEQLQGATKRSLPAFQKAIHATREGQYATAAKLFAEGLAVDPDNVPARVSYARALYLSDHVDKAEIELEEALTAKPDELLANFLHGVLLQQQGAIEEAADAYRRTLKIDPNHAGALFYLANLHFDTGRYADAAAGYAEAQAAEQEIAPARLLELVARLRAGEPEAEVENAKRLTDLSLQYPDDPMLSYALARLLAAAADPQVRAPEQALEITSRLNLLQPIPPHQRALALSLAANGRYEQAAKIQQQAIAVAAWMAPPAELEAMKQELAGYEKGEIPAAWPQGDILLSPPLFDPVAPFRDYPAAVPY